MNSNGTTEEHLAVQEFDAPFPERMVELVIVCVIIVIALVGNISLWIIILCDQNLRTTSNWLLLCLSGADVMVSAINMPVTMFHLVVGREQITHKGCVVIGFVSMLTFVTSVMSLASISWNRYMFICSPVKFRSIYTVRRTQLIIAGTWVFSACLATPPLFGWGRYGYLPGQSFCFCQWKTSISYTFFMVGVCFGGPCTVMTFCYVKILQEVRRSRQRLQGNNQEKTVSIAKETPHLTCNVADADGTPDSNLTNRSVISGRQLLLSVEEMAHQNGPMDQIGPVIETEMYTAMSSSALDMGCSGAVSVIDNETAVISQDKHAYNHAFSNHLQIPERRTSCHSKTKKTKKLMDKGATSMADARRREKREKKRAEELKLTVTFLVVIFAFIVLWMPFCVTMFISVFSDTPVPRIPDMITLLLGCLNSCCNPIIYGVMNTKFRVGYAKLYCSLCRKVKNRVTPIIIQNGSYQQHLHSEH